MIPITPETSYFIGLAQTDGHLGQETKNRGRFAIELSIKDQDIIHKIAPFIPYNYSIYHRTRTTNFARTGRDFIGLRVYNHEFREWLVSCGVPCGKKSTIIEPPLHLKDLSIPDYVRGLWDGDGSVGITGAGLPFLSFTTQSLKLTEFLGKYITPIIGVPFRFHTPKRDPMFNVMITKEHAVSLANALYPDDCLAMSRKYEKAQQVRQWVRPNNMIKVTWEKRKWKPDEDQYILSHSIEESVAFSHRTAKSVEMRKWRLLKPSC